MIEELKQKLGEEVEKLQYELNVTLPNEIRKAVELGDLRENSEYKAALERQQFVQARLGQLRERLSKLASIDPAQIPNDRVGLGSKVVVEDQKTSGTETYYLVFGDAQAHALGRALPAAVMSQALIVLADEPKLVLADAAAKRRLWNALRSVRRVLASAGA